LLIGLAAHFVYGGLVEEVVAAWRFGQTVPAALLLGCALGEVVEDVVIAFALR